MKIIDMKNYIGDKKIISGRKNGCKARVTLRLEELEKDNDIIKIVIPMDVLSFNSSYFLGMLGESVRKFGSKEAFLNKYQFSCNEIVKININDGIIDALNNNNALED